LRKLKLLGVLLAMIAVTVASTVSPAMATHWDLYSDEWGDCGYMQEGWDYDLFTGEPEPEYSPFEECHNYWLYSDDWGLFGPECGDDERYDRWDGPYDHEHEDDGPFHDHCD
jgi:hypothetical protein